MPPPKHAKTLVRTSSKQAELNGVIGWLAPEEYRVVHTLSSGEEVIVPVEYSTVLPPPSFDSGDTVFAMKATKAHKKMVAEAPQKKKADARKQAEARTKAEEGTASDIYIYIYISSNVQDACDRSLLFVGF